MGLLAFLQPVPEGCVFFFEARGLQHEIDCRFGIIALKPILLPKALHRLVYMVLVEERLPPTTDCRSTKQARVVPQRKGVDDQAIVEWRYTRAPGPILRKGWRCA
jgi:hypothetical protein